MAHMLCGCDSQHEVLKRQQMLIQQLSLFCDAGGGGGGGGGFWGGIWEAGGDRGLGLGMASSRG